ncbi:ABC transporter substrate-binding protein [Oceanobacillus chungangensis]|uniref:Sugar ABC transporter substrate-binding protein n=1 Tax=Oceanobacillus chungangensis TaxID=1229152 RepID=A0A3D8PM16_9BACI|nr:extracellular solute-binding protein [Oceanobacillus chungangensis]RDW16712.1 sugar ABC transporter substrate-binding protein [Oceanobacillus chungangensis]
MKKLLFLFVVSSILLLVACDGGTSETKGESAGDKTIEFWHIEPGERGKIFEEVAAQFEEENPGVKVKLTRIPNDTFKEKLSVAMSGGEVPDVFQSWGGGWLKNFADNGNVLDITADVEEGHFNQLTLDNSTYDGKVYGLPIGLTLDLVFYNKEIFDEYGLVPPETFDEWLTIIDVLNENDIIPIALTNQTKWPGAYYLMNFAARIGGPELFNNAHNRTGQGFDDPAYVQAGEYIQKLVESNAFNPGFNGVPYDEGQGRQLLYSGQAAMMDMTISLLNSVRDEAPDFEEKLDFFIFPSIPGGKGVQTQVGGSASPVFSVYAESEHPDLATEFIKLLTSKEVAHDYVERTGSLSAVAGVEPEDPLVKRFYDIAENATHIQMPYDQTLEPELGELHKDTTQALFGLEMTPEEAAKKMEEKAKELLD